MIRDLDPVLLSTPPPRFFHYLLSKSISQHFSLQQLASVGPDHEPCLANPTPAIREEYPTLGEAPLLRYSRYDRLGPAGVHRAAIRVT